MARTTKPGRDHEPVTLRAARLNGKYVIIAAVITAVVGAATGVGVALLGANDHGSAPSGTYNSFSMMEACWVQHNDPSLTDQYENWNDPNSWVCVNSSGAVVGAVNIQDWCNHKWPGSTAVNIDNTVYGWRCRTLLCSLIAGSPKHSRGGDSKGYGLAPECVGYDGPGYGRGGVPVWRSDRDHADDLVGQVRADEARGSAPRCLVGRRNERGRVGKVVATASDGHSDGVAAERFVHVWHRTSGL
jgi:hypothetical protein